MEHHTINLAGALAGDKNQPTKTTVGMEIPTGQIMKVQRDAGGSSILIYNQDRSYMNTFTDPKDVQLVIRLTGIKPMKKLYARFCKEGETLCANTLGPQPW
jgi:hypothetical protein